MFQAQENIALNKTHTVSVSLRSLQSGGKDRIKWLNESLMNYSCDMCLKEERQGILEVTTEEQSPLWCCEV